MIEEKPKTIEVKKSTSKPGARLKQARIEGSISIKEIAKKLRLTEQLVTLLEEDNYSKISSLVYLRGYLTNYARLVELNPDDVLSDLNMTSVQQELSVPHAVCWRVETTPFLSPVRLGWLGAIIVFVILGCAAYWWHERVPSSALNTEVVPPLEIKHASAQPSVTVGLKP